MPTHPSATHSGPSQNQDQTQITHIKLFLKWWNHLI